MKCNPSPFLWWRAHDEWWERNSRTPGSCFCLIHSRWDAWGVSKYRRFYFQVVRNFTYRLSFAHIRSNWIIFMESVRILVSRNISERNVIAWVSLNVLLLQIETFSNQEVCELLVCSPGAFWPSLSKAVSVLTFPVMVVGLMAVT